MKYVRNLVLRLAIALALGVWFKIFYVIFSPITLYSSSALLKIFGFDAIVGGKDLLIVNGEFLRFVKACTAASAYYLLVLLILLTKDVKFWKRLGMFFLGSFLILVMNLARINILVWVLLKFSFDFFLSVHLLFWKLVSTIFVVAVWIFLIKIFKIEKIPAYSDIVYLLKQIRKRKNV